MSTVRVDFTRAAAERIANVVRTVERGNRNEAPLSFARILDEPSRDVHHCGWTGTWGYNMTHEVTLAVSGAGSKTAVAINRYFGFKPATSPFEATGEGVVVRGRGVYSGSWVLVCYSLYDIDNFLEVLPSNETVQFLGHGGTGPEVEEGGPFLKWHSITTCEAST